MNFDINKVRSVIRGEVNGSVRFLVFSFCAAAVWIAVMWLSDSASSVSSTLSLQQGRYNTLLQLAAEYRLLAPAAKAGGTNTDVMTAFTEVSSRLTFGERVSRIVPTPDGRSLSIEVNRLYAEELTEMVDELAIRGIRVNSAEIRALPAGTERLFSLTAVIGSER